MVFLLNVRTKGHSAGLLEEMFETVKCFEIQNILLTSERNALFRMCMGELVANNT